MTGVVIVDAVRTPIGRFRGALSGVRADHLGASVLRAIVERNGVTPDVVDDVVFGCVTQIGEQCGNIARTALLAMQGVTEPAWKHETALLARSVKGTADRESYLPAQLTTNDDGELIAFPLKWGGSSDFVAFALTTALVIVPAGTRTLEANSIVRVLRLP